EPPYSAARRASSSRSRCFCRWTTVPSSGRDSKATRSLSSRIRTTPRPLSRSREDSVRLESRTSIPPPWSITRMWQMSDTNSMATSYSLGPTACWTTLAQASVRASATSPWQSAFTPRRRIASRQIVRTRGTVTTSRGRRNEYRISTGKPLPDCGTRRTCGRTGQWQGYPESGGAGPDEIEPAAVGLHQGPGQGQADAVAAGPARPPVEQAGAGLGVDARALVLDGEMAVVAGRLDDDPDRPGPVAEGVVEQHVEGLADRPGGGLHPHRPGGDELGGPALHLEAGAEVPEVGRGQDRQVEGLGVVGPAGAGQPEQLGHGVGQPLGLLQGPGRLAGHRRIVSRRQALQPQPEAGEGAAELVRGVGRELPLGLDEGGDAGGAGVEGGGDGVDLLQPAAGGRGREVAGPQAPGGPGQIVEGGGQPAGLDAGQPGGHGQAQGPEPPEGQPGLADLGPDELVRRLQPERDPADGGHVDGHHALAPQLAGADHRAPRRPQHEVVAG